MRKVKAYPAIATYQDLPKAFRMARKCQRQNQDARWMLSIFPEEQRPPRSVEEFREGLEPLLDHDARAMYFEFKLIVGGRLWMKDRCKGLLQRSMESGYGLADGTLVDAEKWTLGGCPPTNVLHLVPA
jgi:hypothetical protein